MFMPVQKTTKKPAAKPATKDLGLKKSDANKVKGGAVNLGP
jgi:hypothetical protein